jgi:hypothetical protein
LRKSDEWFLIAIITPRRGATREYVPLDILGKTTLFS